MYTAALFCSVYNVSGKKLPLYFASIFAKYVSLLTDFHNSVNRRLSSKFFDKAVIKSLWYLKLKRVATLPCEMFVLKQRHAPEMSEANSRASC